MTTLADLGPGAVTMIGISALQDVRDHAAFELRVAAMGYCDDAASDAEFRAWQASLERAALAFADAARALQLVTTAAKAATGDTP